MLLTRCWLLVSQWLVSQVAAILLLQEVFGLTEWKLRWKWIVKKLDVNWALKTPLSNYLAVQTRLETMYKSGWDRVMDAQRMKRMAKKLKLKYMVKWMKRKSDPTWGFIKILAAKKKKKKKKEEKKKWMEKDLGLRLEIRWKAYEMDER